MASDSSASLISSGTDGRDAEDIEHELEVLERSRRQSLVGSSDIRRPSIYIQTFENMVHTVLEHEYHLLSEEEWDVLKFFAKLPYNARYVLARLILRKPNQWYCLSGLEKYKTEVGEDGIVPAILELCRPIHEVANSMDVDVKEDVKIPIKEEREIIDLTLDDSDGEQDTSSPPIHPETSTSHLHPSSHPAANFTPHFSPSSTELNLPFICEDECSMSLADTLERLSVKQLADLAKTTKTQVLKPSKPSFISALLYYSSTQSSLGFTTTPQRKGGGKGKARDDGFRQSTLSFPGSGKRSGTAQEKSPQRTQEARLRAMGLEMLGKCVRVNYDFFRLIRRLHIIFYRSTEHPTSLLLPALLTSFKKRSYPEYKYGRDCNIWSTREELMNYEEALEIEARIDALDIGTGREFARVRHSKTPAAMNGHQFVTPATPGMGGNPITPTQTPGSSSSACVIDTPGKVKLENGDEDEVAEVKESIQLQKARIVKTVFDELVYPRWKDLLVVKEEEGDKRRPGLERFEPGYVYTRITQKAAHALGMLKEYEYQAEVIDALLGQRLWRRGKRATWHERRAVLLTRYLCFDEDGRKKEHVLREAMRGVVEALKDEDTGIVYRPSLVRRLVRLEKHLKVPERERCVCEGELKKADEVYVEAVRVWHRAGSMKLDANGRVVGDTGKENQKWATPKKGAEAREHLTPDAGKATSEREGALESPMARKGKKPETRVGTTSSSWRWKGKSLWLGDGGEEVNVETRALQYYESLGYRGFHSETRILTTIFALLFWDIIFADVAGAFETPYQSAPLDMAEDAFYYMRKDLIEVRLTEINDGRASEILERHDSKYREKETWCIGVRWDICDRSDLVEIIECLGGRPLAIICRLFCEDYAGRSSGVPDLIVWNANKGLCKFVEVKGPGDTAQENQKLWFDSLLGAGTAVEVCKVVERGRGTKKKGSGKRPKVRQGKESAKTAPSRSEDEDLVNGSSWNSQIELDLELKATPSQPRSKRPATDDYELPVFTSSPAISTPNSTPIRRTIINRAEVVIISPSKKRKLT